MNLAPWGMRRSSLASMVAFGAVCLALSPRVCRSQQPVATAQTQQQLSAAIVGSWTGVLEYRDYSSNERVKLPTWLEVQPEGQALRLKYVYDDGPTKVVQDAELVTIDAAKATYTVLSKPGEGAEVSSITGLDGLKSGRGTLMLTGTGTENGHAVDVRTTLHIGRNILEILRETRVPGEEFKFRHAYTFTRSTAPNAAAQH